MWIPYMKGQKAKAFLSLFLYYCSPIFAQKELLLYWPHKRHERVMRRGGLKGPPKKIKKSFFFFLTSFLFPIHAQTNIATNNMARVSWVRMANEAHTLELQWRMHTKPDAYNDTRCAGHVEEVCI
jgi:hypothetical protein